MEFAMASAIGVLVAGGVYLLLRARTFDVILGLTLLSYATNLLIFSSGRLVAGKPPILRPAFEPTTAAYTDPLPQALVLTAIVIAFAMTAIVVVVAMRNHHDLHSDHVDGRERDRGAGPRPPEVPGDADGTEPLPAPTPAREGAAAEAAFDGGKNGATARDREPPA